MKILFVTTNNIRQSFGGALASKRNYETLCSIAGKDSVDLVLLEELPNIGLFGKIRKFLCKFFLKRQFCLDSVFKIDFKNYNVLFNDNSVTGEILKIAQEKGFKGKKITFFHNCEMSLYSQMYSRFPWYKRVPLMRIVQANEKISLTASDQCILLNQRDYGDLKKYYPIEFNHIVIPITLNDRFELRRSQAAYKHSKPLFVFLGSYFGPNVNGILWFLENVFPHVDIQLLIIGKNMHKIASKIGKIKNVQVLSDVEDLDTYLYEADCMLLPIFDGSGMKLKTCEALMFGKNIIGTPEAFVGYDIDDVSRIGACCKSAEDFIYAINQMNKPHFNAHSREIYLKKYSYDASFKLFKNIF